MTEQPAGMAFGCLFMNQADDYIPIELWHEAKNFVKEVSDDVEIYKIIAKTEFLQPCEEAEKFCAYWSLERYKDFPHALIVLYENKPLIDMQFNVNDVMNAFECFQMRFKSYYLLLKDKGMIE